MHKNILLTGSSGFVGQHFLDFLSNDKQFVVSFFDRNMDIEKQVKGVDVIVHAAGLAHNPKIKDKDSYFKANFYLTQKIAKAAKVANVKQFIFLSTIKVLGEYNTPDSPFDESSPYNPSDYYSESKMHAEKFLISYWGVGLSILRPVIIYGEGAKGNFKTLKKFCSLPLPIKSIKAKRSIIHIDSLNRLIIDCIKNNKDSHLTINATDTPPMTLAEITQMIANENNKKTLLLPFPEVIIHLTLLILRKQSLINRLLKDFIVKSKHNYEELTPP